MCGVYMFENKINHHKYIGASKHIEKRYKEHLRDMENNTQKQKRSKLLKVAPLFGASDGT